jgi:hypothetical protein
MTALSIRTRAVLAILVHAGRIRVTLDPAAIKL